MNKPKRKTYVKKYGCEHTERYIQALETYINELERAVDKGSNELHIKEETEVDMGYVEYHKVWSKDQWKEWCLNGE